MKSWLKFGIILCLSALLLVGCSLGIDKEKAVMEQSTTLKVMHFNEDYFHQEYGMLFSTVYPNIQLEFVDTSDLYGSYMEKYDQDYTKAMEAFIEKEQPDVILLDNPTNLRPFIDNGTLLDLDSFVAEKDYNAQGLIPGVLDSMKEVGSGKVYTIPTSFSTQVLFYNKDLFDQFSIPYPTDQMTWDELIILAKQFPIDGGPQDRLFGLSIGQSNDLSELVAELANSQGIQIFNAETLQMTMDTPAWAAIVEQAENILQSNFLFYDDLMYNENMIYESAGDSYTNDPFLNGRLAIKLSSNHFISQIEDARKNAQYPEDIVHNWDIVTAPVSSLHPDSTSYTSFYNFVAINAASTNKDAAWKYISYITGDEYARVMSKVQYANVPIRTSYLEKDTARNYAALYKLKPTNENFISFYLVPQRFQFEISEVFLQTFAKIAEGQLTIEQALAEIQIKGNELLATDLMTQEELETYMKSKQDDMSGVIVN